MYVQYSLATVHVYSYIFYKYKHVLLCYLLCIYVSIRWETLWSGLPQQKEAEKRYRTFSPPLKNIDYPTKLVVRDNNCYYYIKASFAVVNFN